LLAIDPPLWSEQELEAQRQIAITNFRRERTEEPLEDYLEAFDRYQGVVEELLEVSVDLSRLSEYGDAILTNPELLEAFRYLAGPPISLDDLKTLADIKSLASQSFSNNPDSVARLIDVIRATLDRRRFLWISENREPTDAERSAAVLASAALLASSRTATSRRNVGKTCQEGLVRQALINHEFIEIPTRPIPTLYSAPQAGQFCGEAKLGDRKADFVVRLWDNRVMPIECKVSNSSTNSVKRLNNDAAVKAEIWVKDFGTRQVVPTAVLSGVYKLHNLVGAQNRGLTLFWAHQLDSMKAWIDATKES
jgi:hypothetical protein